MIPCSSSDGMEDDSKRLEDPGCFQCSRRRPFSRHMTVLLPLIVLLSVCNAMCPTKCQCNDEELYTSCSFAGLQVVPIQLNPELRHINLSHNKIDKVHFTLDIYENLITLDISHNRIQKLGAMNFFSQKHLDILQLNDNEIEGLEKDVFKGLKSLKKLDVSTNKIEEISPQAFNDLNLLQILILNNNRIVSFESDLFKHQKYLKVLQLDDNQLLEVPSKNLLHMPELEKLSLARNLVEYINESSLPTLKNLKYLAFDTNVISEIHGNAFDGFTSLENLNLSDNNFTIVPTSQLSKLSNLMELHLSGNFFDVIPPVAFRGLFKLKNLYLNGIETLTKIDNRAFVDNINLETVELNDNIDLSTLPTRLFHGNPKLTHISIKNNMLPTLEATHFPLDQLISLNIGENPLQCNCSLLWLWKLVTEQKTRPVETNTTNLKHQAGENIEMSLDIDEIKCAGPEKVKGALLSNLPEYEIRCSLNWIAVATGTGTVIFVLTVISIALVYSGLLRRCTREKTYRGNRDSYQTDQSAATRERRGDKCEHMIGPPLLSEYQTLQPWEYPQNKEIDMYRQFGYHTNIGHGSRPHIVYV